MTGRTSFEPSLMLKITTRIFLFATVSLPYGAISQSQLDLTAAAAQLEIVERIQELEALNGLNSEDLIEPLTALGMLYREGGNHDLAAAAIQRARQIVRANYGLSSLDQAPLIQLSIDNEQARGNAAAAWTLEQELLSLAREHPDDLRTVPILRGIGNHRMEILRRYIAGEYVPEILLGCFYRLPRHHLGRCHAGSKRSAVRAVLAEAHENYLGAIEVIRDHELYSSDELRELEMEIVRNVYVYGPTRDASGAYQLGRESLRRLLEYEIASSAPLLRRFNALIRIADWDLLYANYRPALEVYEQAHAELEQEGMAQASIERILSPPTPVVLPTFLRSPLDSDSAEASTGHIDVTFEITRYGRSRRIEVIDKTNATDAAADRLVRQIKRSRFRPRLVDNQFADTPPIVVRYAAIE